MDALVGEPKPREWREAFARKTEGKGSSLPNPDGKLLVCRRGVGIGAPGKLE